MIGVEWWQAILNFLGSVLAALYNAIPNYGVAIILLTLLIRLLLLPLGIKQIRSMQRMQALQPKIKAIQAKYKGRPDGRQKISEETMALYREYGVNPLGGCLPLLLQLPVLVALFAVLRVPSGIEHIPADSALHQAIAAQNTDFLGANLLCTAGQAGKQVPIVLKPGETNPFDSNALNCGSGVGSRIPYYAFALLMVGTTFYQQRQMQRASPGGSSQQQALTRIMPLMFGVWGFLFPAGLVVYWTTTNAIQIGQQHFMLPRKGEDTEPVPKARKQGLFAGFVDRFRPPPSADGDGDRRSSGGKQGGTSGRPPQSLRGSGQGRSGSGSSRGPRSGRGSGQTGKPGSGKGGSGTKRGKRASPQPGDDRTRGKPLPRPGQQGSDGGKKDGPSSS